MLQLAMVVFLVCKKSDTGRMDNIRNLFKEPLAELMETIKDVKMNKSLGSILRKLVSQSLSWR